jgi:hypothetical protein
MARNTSNQFSLGKTIAVIVLLGLSARFPPFFLLLIFVLVFGTSFRSRAEGPAQQGKSWLALVQRIQEQEREARQAQGNMEGDSIPEWRKYRAGTRDNISTPAAGRRAAAATTRQEDDGYYLTGEKEIDPWDLPKERPPWELR